jgi:hypothetical protein
VKAQALFQTTTSIDHPAYSSEWTHTAIDKMFNELLDLVIRGLK